MSGGWTVIQLRQDGSEDFAKDWESYKIGFGKEHGEYWLGLETIHALTERAETRLRIDLGDVQGHQTYVEHENFQVDAESEAYR